MKCYWLIKKESPGYKNLDKRIKDKYGQKVKKRRGVEKRQERRGQEENKNKRKGMKVRVKGRKREAEGNKEQENANGWARSLGSSALSPRRPAWVRVWGLE